MAMASGAYGSNQSGADDISRGQSGVSGGEASGAFAEAATLDDLPMASSLRQLGIGLASNVQRFAKKWAPRFAHEAAYASWAEVGPVSNAGPPLGRRVLGRILVWRGCGYVGAVCI